jgi:hypothetical protein
MLADGCRFGAAGEAAFATQPGFGVEPALRRSVAGLPGVDFFAA